MKKRFIELWEKMGASQNPEEEFERVVKLYKNPKRFYHTLNGHIKNCLIEFDFIKSSIKNPLQIEFSIWYHDVIYDTHSKTNEEDSSNLAYKVCIENNLAKNFSKKISKLILFTKHNLEPKDGDTKILLDIDLSRLGKPFEEFNKDSENIRKEYSWVLEKEYKEDRIKVLKSFLERKNIYYNNFFREKYESQARQNLEKSIEILSSNLKENPHYENEEDLPKKKYFEAQERDNGLEAMGWGKHWFELDEDDDFDRGITPFSHWDE